MDSERRDIATAPRGHAGEEYETNSRELRDERGRPEAPDQSEPTREEERRLRELARNDRVVRAEENVQRAIGQELVRGQPKYEFEIGPDGKRYVVSSRSRIDVPENGTPQEQMRDARQALRAALASGDPSSADRSVAVRAAGVEARARAALRREETTDMRAEFEAERRYAAEAYERTRDEFGGASAERAL